MAHKERNREEIKANPSNDTIEKRTIGIYELRMSEGEPKTDTEGKPIRNRTVEGYAATYNSWADMGWIKETIERGAFTGALIGSDVRAFFNHDRNQILARERSNTLTVWEDEKGLKFRFDIPESRNDILEMIERKDVDECSFAFRVKKERYVWTEGDNVPDERYIEEIEELRDISLVTFPAYNDTSVSLRSKEEYRSKQEPEKAKTESSNELELIKMKISLLRHSV